MVVGWVCGRWGRGWCWGASKFRNGNFVGGCLSTPQSICLQRCSGIRTETRSQQAKETDLYTWILCCNATFSTVNCLHLFPSDERSLPGAWPGASQRPHAALSPRRTKQQAILSSRCTRSLLGCISRVMEGMSLTDGNGGHNMSNHTHTYTQHCNRNRESTACRPPSTPYLSSTLAHTVSVQARRHIFRDRGSLHLC